MSFQDPGSSTPARPSLLRQVMPWLFAAGILAYMFFTVDFGKVLEQWRELGAAQAALIGAAYLGYCAVYYLTDVLSFWRAYNRFNVSIGVMETGRLRFASYAVQAVNGALTEIMTVLYMFRVKKTPVLDAASSAGFIYFNETLTLMVFLAYCAFFLPEQNRILIAVPGLGISFWTALQALIIGFWALVPAWLVFWRSGLVNLVPRVRDARVLMAFRQATLRDYGEVFGLRFSNNFISIMANIVILKAIGIKAPAALLFAVVPIMVNVAYWPVSAGGFGGPQLAADFLLKGHGSEAQVLAYSLIWSALFFLTRTLTGLAFFRRVYRAAFPTPGGPGLDPAE